MSVDLLRLSIRQLTAGFSNRHFSPSDLVEQSFAAIEERNGEIRAFLNIRFEEAKHEAFEASKRWRDGIPLSTIDGIPFGVKANIALKGMPWHGGIGTYRDEIAKENAACVELLTGGGAIPLGLLNMHEGALGATTDNPHFGRTHNPWDLTKTPGGSSGGSAAAVAAGFCTFALGTDTMGSVRIPSAYCGIAGHKPSFGLVPSGGLMELSPTLDHVGPHAKFAEDLTSILTVLSTNLRDECPSRPQIGFVDYGGAVNVTGEIQATYQQARECLDEIGDVKILPLSGLDYGRNRRAGLIVSEVEGYKIHKAALERNREGISDDFASMLEWGARQSSEKIAQAYETVKTVGREFRVLFEDCDVIVMPTAPQLPFSFGDVVPVNQADFTALANFAGIPSTAVPMSCQGHPPPSIQFLSDKNKDYISLEVAMRFENRRGKAPVAF